LRKFFNRALAGHGLRRYLAETFRFFSFLRRLKKLFRLLLAEHLEQRGCVHRSRPKEGIRETSLAPEPGSHQVEY